MRIVLRSSGAEVMSAASAEEAFEQVEQWHPDILVSDIGLPDQTGARLGPTPGRALVGTGQRDQPRTALPSAPGDAVTLA